MSANQPTSVLSEACGRWGSWRSSGRRHDRQKRFRVVFDVTVSSPSHRGASSAHTEEFVIGERREDLCKSYLITLTPHTHTPHIRRRRQLRCSMPEIATSCCLMSSDARHERLMLMNASRH